MKNFWYLVNKVINECDILIEVTDARFVEETRNLELEKKIKFRQKKLIIIANKVDLIDKQKYLALKKKYNDIIFFSSKKRLSTTKLLKKLLKEARILLKNQKKEILIGVIGYPNVGKSSIINALKGKHSAPTASISGYTKNIQKIKLSEKIYMLDTPGVIPIKQDDEVQLALMNAKSAERLNDPEQVAIKIIEINKEKIIKYYEVESCDDQEELLKNIAIKRKKLLKGGIPDIRTISMQLVKDWQLGKFD